MAKLLAGSVNPVGAAVLPELVQEASTRMKFGSTDAAGAIDGRLHH